MKRILSILLLLFCCSLTLLSQSQQQVIVQEYRAKSQKTPLEGVSLSVQNAGSTISDAQGSIMLQFRTLKAGDAVQVRRVDYSGYEIFNRDAVDQWTISPQKPFTLILCSSNRFKELRDQYMRVSSQSYERQYKQDQARLNALRQQNKLQEEAYQQQLADLENSYNEQLDNLENYVDRFARIDLSVLSDEQQRLIDLVQEGKMDEAISLYESADYLSQYKTQLQDLKKIEQAQNQLSALEQEKLSARSSVEEAIYRQVLTYKLAGGQENFAKVTSLLRNLAEADTTNISAVWEYCSYCQDQNIFDECEKYMNIYLRHTEENKVLQIRACEVLGEMFFAKYEFDLAEKYYMQAISLCQDYAAADKSLLVEAQTELHTLYLYTNRPQDALSFSEQLREDLEQCYAQDTLIWHKRLAILYAEQGKAIYQTDEKKADEAEALLIRGYQMTEENSEERYYILSDLNEFYYNSHQWSKMEPFLLEDLRIREDNYKKNPEKELYYLLGVNINLCELYYNLDQSVKSHQYLETAESLLQQIAEKYDESAYVFDIVNLSDAASQLYHKEGNYEQMRKYASQCLDAYQKLPDELQVGLEELVKRNQNFLK